ncbi:MAG: hypothetical protein NG740_01405 [Omnitrophica bacterium]|nr:hypothetical protein [Candidatus Omnitrophota bacterium]
MKRTIVALFLISSFAFADGESDVITFTQRYKPYENAAHTIKDICSVYVNTLFFTGGLKETYISQLSYNPDKYIVHFINEVAEPRPDVLKHSPFLVRERITEADSEIELAWIVDTGKKEVSPYNYLAQDSMNLFEDMLELLGFHPIPK